jgi:membrane protein implicated in regulation of membrane protease activity
MIWWYWILLGLVLAAIELATPGGFFVIFFAVGAVLVGLIEVAGILEADPAQWALFTVVSLASLALFRKPLLQRMKGSAATDAVDSLVGELAIAAEAILPGQYGRAQLRGSAWTVRNVGERTTVAGERSRVVAVRGLELDIRPERGA